MKYYIIAGEASGDLHGSNLMRAMRDLNPNVNFRFWGGDEMQQIGGEPVKHIRELAFMGFIEVVMNLRTILGNIRQCKSDILNYQPDALILIDYPGFNMRIAEWAKQQGIRVYYYISPQIWAWKQNRVHKLKKTVDKMLVILPFERAFYARFGMDVIYVGHPLLDAIQQYTQGVQLDFYAKNDLKQGQPIIALLPGSRKQEINVKLPVMLEAAKELKDFQIVIAGAPSQSTSFYQPFLKDSNAQLIHGQTYNLLSVAQGAMVTSGTATLETALFGVPQVVCYKGSYISYRIAKRLIKVKYISLVNLILDKEAVKELIQNEMTSKNILKELRNVLPGGLNHNQVKTDYDLLREQLGGGGASKNAAREILEID
jgi:lipid-A-disaccharide synthase